MKIILCFVIILLCMVSCSTAEPSGILTIAPGSYTIGVDFPAGLWTIFPVEAGQRVSVTWQQEGVICTRVVVGFGQKDKGSEIVPALDVDLIANTILSIQGNPAKLEPNTGDMVWVSRSGKKYHRIADCSAMKDPLHITEAEAIKKKKSPCANCSQ